MVLWNCFTLKTGRICLRHARYVIGIIGYRNRDYQAFYRIIQAS